MSDVTSLYFLISTAYSIPLVGVSTNGGGVYAAQVSPGATTSQIAQANTLATSFTYLPSADVTQGTIIVNGTTPVATSCYNVSSSSIILFSCMRTSGLAGAGVGSYTVSTIWPGNSFAVRSNTAGDLSTISWKIF